MCMSVHTLMCQSIPDKVREQPAGVSFFLLLHGIPGIELRLSDLAARAFPHFFLTLELYKFHALWMLTLTFFVCLIFFCLVLVCLVLFGLI